MAAAAVRICFSWERSMVILRFSASTWRSCTAALSFAIIVRRYFGSSRSLSGRLYCQSARICWSMARSSLPSSRLRAARS